MSKKKTATKVFALLFVVLIGIGLYVFLFDGSIDTGPATSGLVSERTGGSVLQTQADTQATDARLDNLLQVLANLEGVSLSSGLLADGAWQSLRDVRVVVTPTSQPGRPNPFRRIGSESFVSGTGDIPLDFPDGNPFFDLNDLSGDTATDPNAFIENFINSDNALPTENESPATDPDPIDLNPFGLDGGITTPNEPDTSTDPDPEPESTDPEPTDTSNTISPTDLPS